MSEDRILAMSSDGKELAIRLGEHVSMREKAIQEVVAFIDKDGATIKDHRYAYTLTYRLSSDMLDVLTQTWTEYKASQDSQLSEEKRKDVRDIMDALLIACMNSDIHVRKVADSDGSDGFVRYVSAPCVGYENVACYTGGQFLTLIERITEELKGQNNDESAE